MTKIDLYNDFVNTLLSKTSSDHDTMLSRLNELQEIGVNVPKILTGSMGLSSESGELMEIVKKTVWQGKIWDAETEFHVKRELGDIIFYWMVLCQAINMDPMEVIAENVRKLESRYPGGSFDAWFSNNRKEGDL